VEQEQEVQPHVQVEELAALDRLSEAGADLVFGGRGMTAESA